MSYLLDSLTLYVIPVSFRKGTGKAYIPNEYLRDISETVAYYAPKLGHMNESVNSDTFMVWAENDEQALLCFAAKYSYNETRHISGRTYIHRFRVSQERVNGWLEAYGMIPVKTKEETPMNDPRDTSYFLPQCKHCGLDSLDVQNIKQDICCIPESVAPDEEISQLAAEYDIETPYTPKTDEELSEAIQTEVFGEKQQDTQQLLHVKTLYGKPIPGIWPLESFLQKGFRVQIAQNHDAPHIFVLFREYSPTDADWLIAYAAQGGGL